MAKHKPYDYSQSVIGPIFLEDQLLPGTLEYAIHYIVEERLNMSVFDARYRNDNTGRKSIDPKLLLKIVLYGYSRGMISSRSLEYACEKITTFMALACNRTPDHSTIAAFVSSIICPTGKALYIENRNYTNSEGYKYISYRAPKTACRNCKLRSKCLRNPKTEQRQVHILKEKRPPSITDKMREKIDAPEGRKTYSKRIGIVEPVFGNIRSCRKMDRFTLRGKVKVAIQWKLYCLVHNIEKILNYGESFAIA